MKSLALNSDVDVRWGIERWENEGGRVRIVTTVPTGMNRPPDEWTRERSHDFSATGLSVWSKSPFDVLAGGLRKKNDI